MDEIAGRLGDILAARFQLSYFGFSVWDEKRRLFVERVPIPSGARPVHVRIEDLDDYGFGIAVKGNAPRLVSDIEQEGLREGEWRARKTFRTRSYVTIPIHVRGHVAGALGLGSPRSEYFDGEVIDLLGPLASLLGMKAAISGSILRGTSASAFPFSPARCCWPAQTDAGNLYVVALGGTLFRIDASSGAILGKLRFHWSLWTSSSASSNEPVGARLLARWSGTAHC